MKRRSSNPSISIPAPAKINLFLSVGGKREDGFHELVTVLVKLDLCDLITLEPTGEREEIICRCIDDDSLSGDRNLASQAVRAWREATGDDQGVSITIKKRIPIMAGLGGGSSDASATLGALNNMHGNKLSPRELSEVAARLGSDCPAFLVQGGCVAGGRGEKVRALDQKAGDRLAGRRIFLLKPPIGFSTREVYVRFADAGDNDSWSGKDMMKVVRDWEDSDLEIGELTRNDLQAVVFEKYPFMPAMFEILNRQFGSNPLMSGSGSCCFVAVSEAASFDQFALLVRESWGEEAFVFEARIRP